MFDNMDFSSSRYTLSESGHSNKPRSGNRIGASSYTPNSRDSEVSISEFLESLVSGTGAKLSKVHRSVARVLARKLRNVKSDQITFSRIPKDDHLTVMNRAQNFVEKIIGLPLDWWPLPASRQYPAPGSPRIAWSCVSMIAQCYG